MFAKLSLPFLAALVFVLAACFSNDGDGVKAESSSSTELEPSSSSKIAQSLSSSSRTNQSSSSIVQSSSSRTNQSSSSIVQSSSSKINQSSSSQGISSSSVSNGPCTTKTCIDNEINANWQRLGYKSKPTKVIALSFDDGPCSKTQSLLDALANKEVKTTFFLIGQNIRGNKAAAQAIYAAGHELANHSDGYDSNPSKNSVQTCSNEIKNIMGSNPTLFRAPNVAYGSVDGVCKDLNLPMIDVSCWSNDYNGINSTQIRTNVKNCATDGGIVNLHEFNTATGNNAAGIEGLVNDLRDAGFWILPVGQMAMYKNKTLVGGQKYSNF